MWSAAFGYARAHLHDGALAEDAVQDALLTAWQHRPTVFRPMYDLQLDAGEEAIRAHAGDVLLSRIVQDLVAAGATTPMPAVVSSGTVRDASCAW